MFRILLALQETANHRMPTRHWWFQLLFEEVGAELHAHSCEAASEYKTGAVGVYACLAALERPRLLTPLAFVPVPPPQVSSIALWHGHATTDRKNQQHMSSPGPFRIFQTVSCRVTAP